jgi:hypothetical protein
LEEGTRIVGKRALFRMTADEKCKLRKTASFECSGRMVVVVVDWGEEGCPFRRN